MKKFMVLKSQKKQDDKLRFKNKLVFAEYL